MEAPKMTLYDIFSKNKDIIINTDIDGFLSGMLLQKYFGCRVVGFSNSKDKIWIDETVKSIYTPVYIDLYVARKDVVCIEQHIIAYNQKHSEILRELGTKINPNLERDRFLLGDYYHKYPFGTVHYIMSLMEKEGISVNLGDLFENQSYTSQSGESFNTTLGHIFLRADDALHTTLSQYRDNALDWWRWLDQDKKYRSIQSLLDFINSCSSQDSLKYKNSVGNFFLGLGCDAQDGAFNEIVTQEGFLLEKVVYFMKVIGSMVDVKLVVPNKYNTHKGEFKKKKFVYPADVQDIIMSKDLYSYAFIYGRNSKYANFSYTLNMRD